MTLTAKKHFNEDIDRAWALFNQAIVHSKSNTANPVTTNDLWLSAVALSVGAMDAYLCDAYVDCLSTALRTYAQNRWVGQFPSAYSKQQLPAGEVLNSTRSSRPLWSIRMAARKLMERENMLAISKVDDLFNPILPPSQKIWGDFIVKLISHNRKRFTQHTSYSIASLSGKKLNDAYKLATSTAKRRISQIIQIRHDWIHNCGRPKSKIEKITKHKALAAIRDIQTFVDKLDLHLRSHRIV